MATWAVLLTVALLAVVAVLASRIRLEVTLPVGWGRPGTVVAHWLWWQRQWEFDPDRRLEAALRGLLDRALEGHGQTPADGEAAGRRPERSAPAANGLDWSRLGTWRQLAQHARQAASRAWRRLRPAVRWQQAALRLEVGTGDAMTTALMVGQVWGGLAPLTGPLSVQLRIPAQILRVAVVPVFSGPVARLEIAARLSVPCYALALAGIAAWGSLNRHAGLTMTGLLRQRHSPHTPARARAG